MGKERERIIRESLFMQASTFSSAKEIAEIDRKATKKIIMFMEVFIIVSNRESTYICKLAETVNN